MSDPTTRYFSRVTSGTEALAWFELETMLTVKRLRQSPRTLEFEYSEAPSRLLALRSVDDVYVHLGTLFGMDHTQPSLNVLVNKAKTLDIQQALSICRKVRSVPVAPSYAITASLESSCNYSRFEVAAALRKGLDGLVGWRYIDHRDNKAVADLDIRVLIDGPRALLGLRLGAQPLHRRTYKLASVPGSLKPPVAYCMLLLANPHHDELLLDPMCGAGTILLETESAWSPHLIMGADIDPAIVAQARMNFIEARNEANLVVANAFHLPLPDGSVDSIVCNLPWGRQVAIGVDANAFHNQLITELARVMRPLGRAILLTDQVTSLLHSLANQPGLHIAMTQQISLFGSHPTIVMLLKQPRRPDPLHPFIQHHDEDEAMTQVVRAAVLSSLNHPDTTLRFHAAQACLRSRDDSLRLALVALANDPVPQIRDVALKVQA